MMKTKEEIMSSPYTRLRTEEEELMYDAGLMDGRDKERERIIKTIQEEWAEYPDVDSLIALIKGENK
jgi:hypothetical protein